MRIQKAIHRGEKQAAACGQAVEVLWTLPHSAAVPVDNLWGSGVSSGGAPAVLTAVRPAERAERAGSGRSRSAGHHPSSAFRRAGYRPAGKGAVGQRDVP
jgi:hypothetical protein